MLFRSRFVKTHLEEVISMKVDSESDEPIPDIPYYMASSSINLSGKDFGKMQMLIPAKTFKLEALAQDEAADDAEDDGSRTKGSVTGAADSSEGDRVKGTLGGVVGSTPGAVLSGAVGSGGGGENPEFLIVSNDGNECSKLAEIFNQRGIAYRILDYKDNVSNYLPGAVRAVFLLMSSVDEKGLGVAIKISAASSLPLVAAGPEWTRTKVIKAVKYGVDDILLTPASDNDIIEKIDSCQAQKAA